MNIREKLRDRIIGSYFTLVVDNSDDNLWSEVWYEIREKIRPKVLSQVRVELLLGKR